MCPTANTFFNYLDKTYPYLIKKEDYAKINDFKKLDDLKKLPLFNYKIPNPPKKPLEIFENSEIANKIVVKKYKGKAIIYMWFNKITGEYYVGSSYGGNRLSNYYNYYYLNKKSPIYKSILKYGHSNHILFIMEDIGLISEFTQKELFAVEQIYIDWNFKINKELALNRQPNAQGGKVIVSKRIGKNNPMYGKIKSAEFIAWQKKDKSGENNPQFGVKKSEETRTKLRKKVYVYDSFTNKLLIEFKGTLECLKQLRMGKGTFTKYIDSDIPFKGKLFYRLPKF